MRKEWQDDITPRRLKQSAKVEEKWQDDEYKEAEAISRREGSLERSDIVDGFFLRRLKQ